MLPSVLPTEADHVPVLADEVLARPRPAPGRHDRRLHLRLRRALASCCSGACSGEGKLIAIDRDPTVAPYFERLRRGSRARRCGCSTASSRPVLEQLAANGVRADAILLDLGVSSMQLDRPERGFSYAADAPLDMRMDPSADLTGRARSSTRRASGSSPTSSAATARSATRARSRARSSAAARSSPFERTGDLVATIKQAIPAPARFGEGHPAKRVFQALRIEVNDELGALERALPGGARDAAAARAPRGDLVPLARGPDRQALPARRRARLHLPARLPALRLRRDADAAGDPAAGDPAERGRGRPQPALGLGPPARGGEGWLAPAAAAVAAPGAQPGVRGAARPRRRPPAPRRRPKPRRPAARRPARARRRRPRSRGAIAWIVVGGVAARRGRLRQPRRPAAEPPARAGDPGAGAAARRERGAPVAALVGARLGADPAARPDRDGLVQADPSTIGYINLGR